MKRFLRKFRIGKRHVKLFILVWNENNLLEALDSGIPYKEPQYLFMDYDRVNPLNEARKIVSKYSLKRALIVESSPSKYHFLSFSPLRISTISEILFFSSCDKRHALQLLAEGRVGIRVVPKPDSKFIPKMTHVINNPDGKNFYNFNAENAYRRMIEVENNEKKKTGYR